MKVGTLIPFWFWLFLVGLILRTIYLPPSRLMVLTWGVTIMILALPFLFAKR